MTDPSGTDIPAEPVGDPVLELIRRMLQAGGRMHKKDVLRLARELGLTEDAVDDLSTKEPKVLDSENDHKVVTPTGRQRLNNMR